MPDLEHRLYYSPGACSLAPHIGLEEIGLPYHAERVTIADGENRKPEYLAVNPRGRVPALVIFVDGHRQVLTESIAIMVYLAQRYPVSRLLPSESDQFARAIEWMAWLGSNVHQATTRTIIRPSSFAHSESAQAEVRECGLERLCLSYDDIELRLEGQQWALGNAFSLVDAYLLVFFRWGGKCGLAMRGKYPNFTAVMDRLRARSSVARVIAAQGIEIE